jgi:hypothetical protein
MPKVDIVATSGVLQTKLPTEFEKPRWLPNFGRWGLKAKNISLLTRGLHGGTMHEPSTNICSSIQVVVEGQQVDGAAYFQGSSGLEVKITHPFAGFTTSVHMPYFARGVYPEGFRGEYG